MWCCSFEGEKQKLKEEVATKRRELQKLREERHNMNAQYERTLASLVRCHLLDIPSQDGNSQRATTESN